MLPIVKKIRHGSIRGELAKTRAHKIGIEIKFERSKGRARTPFDPHPTHALALSKIASAYDRPNRPQSHQKPIQPMASRSRGDAAAFHL